MTPLEEIEASKAALAEMYAKANADPGDTGISEPMDRMQSQDSFSVGNASDVAPTPDAIRAQYTPAAQSNQDARPRTPLPVPEGASGPAMVVQLPAQQGAAPMREGSGDWDFFRAATAFGGGDVGAYDAAQKERRDRPFVQAERLRKTADEDQARADSDRVRADTLALTDPNSPQSKERQDDYVSWLNAGSQMQGVAGTKLADALKEMAANAPKMSGSHIMRALPNIKDMFSEAFKGVSADSAASKRNEDVALKKEEIAAIIGDKKEGRGIQNAEMVQKERFHADEMAAKKAAIDAKKNQLHLTKDQHDLVSRMAKVQELMGMIPDLQKRAADPDLDLGMVENEMNQLESKAPDAVVGLARKIPILGSAIPSKEQHAKFTKLMGDIQPQMNALRLAIEKTVKINPLTLEQLNSFLIKPTDNKETVQDKLRNLPEALRTFMKSQMSELQVGADGEPIDKSLLVKYLGGDPDAAARELSDKRKGADSGAAPKPWPNAKPWQRKRDADTGITWEMQSDGSLKKVQ